MAPPSKRQIDFRRSWQFAYSANRWGALAEGILIEAANKSIYFYLFRSISLLSVATALGTFPSPSYRLCTKPVIQGLEPRLFGLSVQIVWPAARRSLALTASTRG